MIPLVYLGIIFFIKFFRGSSWYFVGAAFFAGLTFQFETATALVIGSVLGILFFFKRNAWKEIKIIVVSILAFFTSFISFILFDIRHNFLMSRSVIQVFQYPSHGPEYLPLWIPRIKSHIDSLLGVFESVFINPHFELLQTLYLAIVLLALFMVFVKKNQSKYKKEILLYVFFPVFIFLFYILYPYPIYAEYVIGFTVTAIFLFVLLAHIVSQNILGKVLVVLFFLVSCLLAFDSIQKQYFTPYIYITMQAVDHIEISWQLLIGSLRMLIILRLVILYIPLRRLHMEWIILCGGVEVECIDINQKVRKLIPFI